jgi:integrase
VGEPGRRPSGRYRGHHRRVVSQSLFQPPLVCGLPPPVSPGLLDDALPHETLPQLRDRALIIFLLPTGCRTSEALTLDRSDWQREQVVVIGKRRKERVVIISPKARAAVDQYLALRTDPLPRPLHRVPARDGRRGRGPAHAWWRWLCMRSGGLGLERWHPHQLRHTFGTAVEEELGGFATHRGAARPQRAGVGERVYQDQPPSTRGSGCCACRPRFLRAPPTKG